VTKYQHKTPTLSPPLSDSTSIKEFNETENNEKCKDIFNVSENPENTSVENGENNEPFSDEYEETNENGQEDVFVIDTSEDPNAVNDKNEASKDMENATRSEELVYEPVGTVTVITKEQQSQI